MLLWKLVFYKLSEERPDSLLGNKKFASKKYRITGV